MADTDEEYLNSDLTGSQIEGILTGIFGVVGILKRKNDTTFEAATIYEVLSGASAPTTSTVGAVNQFYRTSTDLYICTAVSNANYTWTKYTKSISDLYAVSFNQAQTLTDIQKSTALANIAASREVLSGNGAPTTATVGKVNQLYRNTANNKVYICTGTNGTTYTWVEVNPMADIGAVLYGSAQTLSDAQKTQALNNISASRAVLTGAADPTSATTAFINQLYRNTTTNEVFICTEVSGGSSSWISLKYGAPLFSAIQSLTEPQKSRILSNISASREVLSGASDPTTSTVGVVNQFYRNTTSNDVFACTAVSGSTYTWAKIGGSGGGTVNAPVKYGHGTNSIVENNIADNKTAYGTSSYVSGTSSSNVSDSITDFTDDTTIVSTWTAAEDASKFSLAKGKSSHVEGTNCLALGSNSHAEGSKTLAKDASCHSEGTGSKATGKYSHAGGLSSNTSGECSFAHGRKAAASGANAVALNNNTTASGADQTVIGKFNATSADSAFIIGNGTATNAKSNAMTVDWSGNGFLAGKMTVGAAPVNNMDVATKQYVDEHGGGGGTSGAVSYETVQSLTVEQKNRARTNISAAKNISIDYDTPGSDTPGSIGQFYLCEDTNLVYICIDEEYDEELEEFTYEWRLVSGKDAVITTTYDPSSYYPSSARAGSFCFNTNNRKLYICTSGTYGSYTWIELTNQSTTYDASMIGAILKVGSDGKATPLNFGSANEGSFLTVGSDGNILLRQMSTWSGGNF